MEFELIEYVRDYCKFDEEESDESVNSYIEVAKEYLKEAGVDWVGELSARYRLCLASLVLDLHDHRGSGSTPLTGGARLLLNQLKMDSQVRHVASKIHDAPSDWSGYEPTEEDAL